MAKRCVLLAAFAFGVAGRTDAAPVADQLQCYKIHDPAKLSGTVDLVAPALGAAAGCTVSGASLFCSPATMSVTIATADGVSIGPLPYGSPPAEGDRICYKLKCPKAPVSAREETDRFGTRTLTDFRASLICAPAVTGAGFCGNGAIDPGEECDGPDLHGATCRTKGFAGGDLACAVGCTYDASGCVPYAAPTCGNGVRDASEQCDGDDLAGASCTTLGYTLGGTLSCTTGCAFETHGCASQALAASGQTTCWDDEGVVI